MGRIFHTGGTGFGALRALSEELLEPGAGVPLHAHEGMEILTLVLSGTLRYQDSRGAVHVIRPGEIHMLSAGLGVAHREFNNSPADPVRYLQLWIRPRRAGNPVRYAQEALPSAGMDGRLFLAASPPGRGGLVTLDQDAWVSLGRFDAAATLKCPRHSAETGLYAFLAEGRLRCGGEELAATTGLEVTDTLHPELLVLERCLVVFAEVPIAI